MTHRMMAATEWQRETEGRLWAEIQIERRVLDSLVAELAEVRKLRGAELLARFGWESRAALRQAFAEQRAFHAEIEEICCEALLAGR